MKDLPNFSNTVNLIFEKKYKSSLYVGLPAVYFSCSCGFKNSLSKKLSMSNYYCNGDGVIEVAPSVKFLCISLQFKAQVQSQFF